MRVFKLPELGGSRLGSFCQRFSVCNRKKFSFVLTSVTEAAEQRQRNNHPQARTVFIYVHHGGLNNGYEKQEKI